MRCHTSVRFSAIKPGSIHHLEMSVPSQEYDSCCPFFWCVLSIDFAIWLGTFRFLYFPWNSVFLWFYFLHNNGVIFTKRAIKDRHPYIIKLKYHNSRYIQALYMHYGDCSIVNMVHLNRQHIRSSFAPWLASKQVIWTTVDIMAFHLHHDRP